MLISADGKLEIYITPLLRKIVEEKDWAYIESLLHDMEERARSEPESLFRHLCSLSVGSLICRMAGAQIEDNEALALICSEFKRFS